MMRRLLSTLVVAGALATTLSVPVTASAEPDMGREFGQHVSECAQAMEFDGTHNPGTHRGFTGWTPMDVAEHGSR